MTAAQRNNETLEDWTPGEGPAAAAEFTDCVFVRGRFDGAAFPATGFRRCRFVGCSLRNVRFEQRLMFGNHFEDCAVMGVDWGEPEAPGTARGGGAARGRAPCPFVRMRKCVVRYQGFSRWDMKKADFAESAFTECDFSECDLPGADFARAVFDEVGFRHCDLRKADFRDALGYRIELAATRVEKAKFSLPEVVGLLAGTGIVIT